MSISEVTSEARSAIEPLLAGLSDDARHLVLDSFERMEFAFGDPIFLEGDAPDALYVVAAGEARLLKHSPHGEEVSLEVVRPGSWLGELEILSDSPRQMTARASGHLVVMRLEHPLFHALAGSHPQILTGFEKLARNREVLTFLRVFTAFAGLPDGALRSLAEHLEPIAVTSGTIVIEQSAAGDALYLVEDGRLRAYRIDDGDEREVDFLRKGDYFGEGALLRGVGHEASVAAVIDSRLLRLPGDIFHALYESEDAFRERIKKRLNARDYTHLARVPLDFAREVLPAAVHVHHVSPDQATPLRDARSELAEAVSLTREEAEQARAPRPPRRFPHLYQIDEADCGAACLAMVCRSFRRNVALSHIRDIAHTSTDGTSLAGITRAAQDLGLAARSVRASKSRLDQLAPPAVVHWDGGHWVVLYGIDKDSVRVADPAIGLRRLTRDEFLSKWSGYASLIAYTPAFKSAPVQRSNLSWLRQFFAPHKRVLVTAVALAVAAAGLELVLPILAQVIFGSVVPNHDVGLLWIVLAALAATLFAVTAAAMLQGLMLARISVRVDTDSLDFMTGALLRLPMRYFHTRRTGDIERRLAGLRQIRQFVTGSGVTALTAITQLVAAVVLMFIFDWLLALAFLATLPLYLGLLRFSSRRLRPLYEALEEAYGSYASQQIDAIKGIETVKSLAAEEPFRANMLQRFQRLARQVFHTQFLVLAYDNAVLLLGFLTYALFLMVGALQVVNGTLSIGTFVAFNTLVALANAPAVLILSLWDEFQLSKILIGRLDDVLAQQPEQGPDHSSLRPVTTLGGQLEFVGVGFRYGGAESPEIIQDLSFEVEPGTTTAIVGRSGSGKTTMIKLVAGLIEPTAGTIQFDGLDMRTLDYRSLRRQVGVVLQESYLFNDTIARNIAFGEEEPDLDQMVWAARASAAHEFVQRLPLGYDTRVGEAGLQLSGGQRQRIAIARALYHRPPVLLFDEATSALDSDSERRLKQSMDELLENRTAIVIAHRLSTIRDADRILVIEQGRLIEDGRHEELMARQGLYYHLASQQLEL